MTSSEVDGDAMTLLAIHSLVDFWEVHTQTVSQQTGAALCAGPSDCVKKTAFPETIAGCLENF